MKILLWAILGILGLLLLILLLNVKITIGMKNGFYWRLSVGGIRIKPEWFMGKKDGHEKKKKKKKKKKSEAAKQVEEQTGEPKKKKKNIGKILSLVLELAKTAARAVPRGFRIRLKHLNIRVGAPEAADVAISYGKFYAILESAFAALENYKGLLYGFRGKRHKVTITADFDRKKTDIDMEMTISFFIWQLLFIGIRIGAAFIIHTLKNADDEEDDESPEASDADSSRVKRAK